MDGWEDLTLAFWHLVAHSRGVWSFDCIWTHVHYYQFTCTAMFQGSKVHVSKLNGKVNSRCGVSTVPCRSSRAGCLGCCGHDECTYIVPRDNAWTPHSTWSRFSTKKDDANIVVDKDPFRRGSSLPHVSARRLSRRFAHPRRLFEVSRAGTQG
jgi:hypothetical protein